MLQDQARLASKAQYPDFFHSVLADDEEIFKFDRQDSQEETGLENSDDDFDDSLTGIDIVKKLVGMCPEVTEQLDGGNWW